ncbi:MAG: hypothetical protein MUF55_03610 [Hydrogenophaga sp.]|nr:hypothetical protein [Hydrogenophaga sp.]
MSVSPALAVDRVVQTRRGAAALINGVAGNLPLAGSGPVGTQVNTMV